MHLGKIITASALALACVGAGTGTASASTPPVPCGSDMECAIRYPSRTPGYGAPTVDVRTGFVGDAVEPAIDALIDLGFTGAAIPDGKDALVGVPVGLIVDFPGGLGVVRPDGSVGLCFDEVSECGQADAVRLVQH